MEESGGEGNFIAQAIAGGLESPQYVQGQDVAKIKVQKEVVVEGKNMEGF